MPPFAPKLTSDVGYTQAPTAPAAEPSVFSGIGDVLSGALKTADKAFDSFKPKAPTYQQLKDEDELNSLNAFQTGTEKAAQLRAQGFGGRATSMENQIALDYVRAGGDPTSEEAKYMVERISGRSHERYGMSEETHAMMKLQESPEYEAAFLATWSTLPKDATGEDRVQAASVQAMQIFSAKSVVAVATGKSEAQAAMNNLNWDAPGGGRASYELLIENFVGPQLGAAMIADQAGQSIDPTSLANSELQFRQFKTNMLANRPRGVDDTQWSNVSAKLAGISEVYEGLINKGETLKGAHASALIQAVVKNPDISAVVKHVIINTKDFTTFGFTGEDYASAFKALQNTDEPLYKIGDGNPRNLISGAPGFNSGNKGKPKGTISQEALDAYKGDPKKHVETMNGISKYFRGLDSKAAGSETQTVANISQKMAASVYNSTVPFAAADINDAYNTGLIGTIREVGKTDPQTAWALARQHSEALDQMSTKSYQNADKKFGDFAKLGQDGKVRLNWANAFDNLPASGEFRAFIEDEMKAALEPYNGDLYAFTKAYRGSKQGRSDAPKFSRGVSEFMDSMDMRIFMEEGGELKEQMDSLVAINAARGRMQAEADLLDNAYSTAVEAGDEFTQEVAPDSAPVPRERPVVETTAPSAGGILGLGGFPETDGVPLGERAVGKVGDALGDAARYVGGALISPAGASTLPPAKQIENMAQSSYESKLKEYVGSHESNPQLAKDAGYASEYDVPIGFGKFDDPNNPPKPLTTMTFTEVYAYQRTLTNNSKGKLKGVDPTLGSSAVGRWQIIGPTLKRLKKKLGLQDSDKFTKDVQDQMFNALLDEAGQAKFKAGEITSDQFQDNLSKIWASVPNSKGVSAYGQPVQSDKVPLPTAPIPAPRPTGVPEELPESQIMDTVTRTVPDATPAEVKEVTDHLQGANTLDAIRALGARQRAIMSAILNAYSEDEQEVSTVGSGPYRQPTPTPLGE